MRDRRITEMSLIVQVLPKIKTILNKRPSPADREFRILGLCTGLFDVICNTKWRQTHFMRNANKESEMLPRKRLSSDKNPCRLSTPLDSDAEKLEQSRAENTHLRTASYRPMTTKVSFL